VSRPVSSRADLSVLGAGGGGVGVREVAFQRERRDTNVTRERGQWGSNREGGGYAKPYFTSYFAKVAGHGIAEDRLHTAEVGGFESLRAHLRAHLFPPLHDVGLVVPGSALAVGAGFGSVPAGPHRHWTSLNNGTSISRTMISLEVDRSEAVPLHDQVAAEIRRAIADGEAKPGERLPLAKDLAAVLGAWVTNRQVRSS
jgi:hypothetical protein